MVDRFSLLLVVLFAVVRLSVAAPAQVREDAPAILAGQAVKHLIENYRVDRELIERRYQPDWSPWAEDRRVLLDADYLQALLAIDFERLDQAGRVDWWLLRLHIERRMASPGRDGRRLAETEKLIPFALALVNGLEAPRGIELREPEAMAAMIEEQRKAVAARRAQPLSDDPQLRRRAAGYLDDLDRLAARWFGFYEDYDPIMTWWCKKPIAGLRKELKAYAHELRGDDATALLGDPIGREALIEELRSELIDYSPQELVAIAEREFAWCDAEMAKAAQEMGCADWREAQDRVKAAHVGPGEQPKLIRDLALEAVAFVAEHDLVTVPSLCQESWRMTMLSPEAQRTSPYFLGGETIQVAFPTADMEQDEKLMSLRSNNRYFARATVHHELIPGHHLQGFMTARHAAHRRLFSTPFWVEGWALYWEMRFWDLGFPKSPEDRIGMLFWRKHRCARIVFSLSFHLGTMSAQECVDYLVERVGHERSAAEAEVRRSIEGDYGPLYQAAYMLGGLQLRALHDEMVGPDKMSERDFHDAVLQRGPIPIALLRAELEGRKLKADELERWRFAVR